MSWLVVVLLAVGSAGQRLVGMYAVGSQLDRRPFLKELADLLPVAVVAALVAQLTVGRGQGLTVDARAVGLAVAALLVWRRAPFVVVVVAAAATTAAIRAVS